jgi:RNA polymerase sigma-70 factor (ECF subfamily)
MADSRAQAGPPAEDDAALVRALRAGDRQAFRRLYHRHSRYVAGTVFRLLGHDQELDDIVQETFLDGHRHLDQLLHPERVRAWLCSIAVRHVQHRLKRRGKQRQAARQAADQLASERAADRRDQELATALYAALDELAPEARTPWILHHVLQHTLPEVAELCGVSLATVKRRIARAQQTLQRRLRHG